MDPEGNEVKFFSSEFLVRKYLKMSDADLRLNKILSEEERKEAQEFSDVEGDTEGGDAGMGFEDDKETKKEKQKIIDDQPDLDKGKIKIHKGLIKEEDKKEKKKKSSKNPKADENDDTDNSSKPTDKEEE